MGRKLILLNAGLIYRQFKPVYWSPSSGTALAEAELEYDDNHVSHSAYIKFRLITVPKVLRHIRGKGTLYALIWTTTPWTLPANGAIAVHNDIQYSVFRRMYDTDLVLCATDRIPEVLTRAGLEEKDIDIVVPSIRGSDIAGQAVYWNSLRGREAPLQPIIHADFVTLASGSGLVHLAPGHGFDDYNVCLKHDIPVFAPVDDHGCFTNAALPDAPKILKGKDIFTEGSKAVLEILRSGSREGGKDLVWATHRIKHKYPIDWRTKKPLIIRATAQWFAGVDTIKDRALASLENVKFLPETGRSRLESFISGRSQWCISRQRAWGVPIPALYHVDRRGHLGEAVMTAESVEHIISVIKERGTDAWWTDAEDESAWLPLSLPKGNYRRGKDTMDVWFDSGSSWTQLPQDRSPPADVYIEGTDQHRGWFQSSLLTYVAQQAPSSPSASDSTYTPYAPYRTLITHGFILDSAGRKMSKSIGNVIAPSQITDGTLLPPMKKRKGQYASDPATYDAMGPDALRLWVASADYTKDVMIGQPVLKSVNGLLHKLRVTFRWLLGALEDYHPSMPHHNTNTPTFAIRASKHHLSTTLTQTHTAYTSYEPYRAILHLTRYVNTHLSAFYFEYAKDLLYAGTSTQRAEVQAMCFEILRGLLTMLAPVTPILVREVVDYAPAPLKHYFESEEHDPFKRVWSVGKDQARTSDRVLLEQQMTWLDATSSAVKAAQEAARAERRMGSGLECRVEIVFPSSSSSSSSPSSSSLSSPPASSTHGDPDNTTNKIHTFLFNLQATGELESLLVSSEVSVVSSSASHTDTAKGEINHYAWTHERSFSIVDTSGERIEGIARVVPPRRGKCPRCWRYQVVVEAANQDGDGVGKHEQQEAKDEKLCERCEVAMGEKKTEE